jgi:hypothetical protein
MPPRHAYAYRRRRQSTHSSRFSRFGLASDGTYRFVPSALPPQLSMIGTGELGGKARGLLFAMKSMHDGVRLTQFQHLLRFPDSTVLTSEVFHAFMERNRLQEDVQAGCDGAITLEELGERIVSATLPPEWTKKLVPLLERETRPLVVRSSSIMEDDPDHSFAGIYLSVFLPNSGPLDVRLQQLTTAIKRVYASTFAPNARAYRKRHGLDWRKERMAILIQNMIGSHYSHELFYPLVGGVAFSRNYYPWTDRLKPEDGVVRLVVGTGTRAVGREYARVFSPRLPGLRPEGFDADTIIRYSQETVDVLDMAAGRLDRRKLSELDNPLLATICSRVDSDGNLREPLSAAPTVAPTERLLASFTRLIETDSIMPLTPLIRELLRSFGALLELPIDIEFAIDFSGPEAAAAGSPLLYLLQVRPLGNRPEHRRIHLPRVREDRSVLECHQVLGNGRLDGIRHLVLVPPRTYRWDKAYEIARSVGRINHELSERDEPYILMGPGRWASTNPQLGVPAQYNELSGASVIVEMSTESFAPELSYGTHFYADMVGSGVLYLPFREEAGDRLNRTLLASQEVAYRDEFVTHYTFRQGLSVFVDGEHQRGVIVLQRPRGNHSVRQRPRPPTG